MPFGTDTQDLIIVGAGPAGLAAAMAAHSSGSSPLLLESGGDLGSRSHSDRTSAVEGVGGAGLFSDGKFSAWPSASGLWSLDEGIVAPAWRHTTQMLSKHGVQIADPAVEVPADVLVENERYLLKEYPSVYASPAARHEMTQSMRRACPRTFTDCEVATIDPVIGGWKVGTTRGELRTRKLILATGRFGPLLLGSCNPETADGPAPLSLVPRRLEVGVRIQQPSGAFFLRDAPQLDPKLLWFDQESHYEWRTFCCCREGLVISTRSRGMLTVSGRADCPPTGRSNVGFNLRVKDADVINRVWPDLQARLGRADGPSSHAFAGVADGDDAGFLAAMFGDVLGEGLRAGLVRLRAAFPGEGLDRAEVIGPTLEGVGRYPEHDNRLRVAQNLWVAGDATGTFRGLTAALVSGYAAGLAALEEFR